MASKKIKSHQLASHFLSPSDRHQNYANTRNRDRLLTSSKYIPKRLLNRIQQMEQEKAGVREILGVLGVVIG